MKDLNLNTPIRLPFSTSRLLVFTLKSKEMTASFRLIFTINICLAGFLSVQAAPVKISTDHPGGNGIVLENAGNGAVKMKPDLRGAGIGFTGILRPPQLNLSMSNSYLRASFPSAFADLPSVATAEKPGSGLGTKPFGILKKSTIPN